MAASAVASRCPSTSRILLTCRAECSVSSTGLRPQIYSGMPFHLQKLAFPVNIASHKHPNLVHELERELHCKYPPVLPYHAAAPARYCTYMTGSIAIHQSSTREQPEQVAY